MYHITSWCIDWWNYLWNVECNGAWWWKASKIRHKLASMRMAYWSLRSKICGMCICSRHDARKPRCLALYATLVIIIAYTRRLCHVLFICLWNRIWNPGLHVLILEVSTSGWYWLGHVGASSHFTLFVSQFCLEVLLIVVSRWNKLVLLVLEVFWREHNDAFAVTSVIADLNLCIESACSNTEKIWWTRVIRLIMNLCFGT